MGKNNPLTFAILNYIVGLLVAKGLVPGEHQDELVTTVSEIVGYGIVLATAIVSLYHSYKSWTHKPGTITIPLDPPPPVVPVEPVAVPVQPTPVAPTVDPNTVFSTPMVAPEEIVI